MAEEKETVILEAEVNGQEDVENLSQAVNKNKEQVQKTSHATDKLAEEQGKAAKSQKLLTKGTKKASQGFKLLGTAIKAAGIGLLIGAVGKLVDFFGNFRSVTVKVEQAMAGFNVILGRVTESAIALFKLDFSSFLDSFDGTTKEIKKVTKAVRDQFKAEDDLFALRKRTIKQNAELEVEREKQLKIVEDTTLASNKRIKAAERLEVINKELLKNQRDEIALQKQVLQEQIKAEDNDDKRRELILNLNRLKSQQIKLEGQAAEIERKAARQRRMIAEQDAKELQARREEEKERLAENEAAKNEIKLRFHNQLMKGLGETADARRKEREELEANEQAKLEIFKRFEQQKIKGVKDKAKREERIKQAELKAEEKRNDRLQQITAEGLQAGAKALGLGKEFAIAKALFETFQSARSAFASQIIPGDPSSLPRAIGASVFATTAGLADVASIKSVKTPNVAGASGGSSGGSQSAQAPQQPSFNLVGNSNSQGITQSEQAQEDSTTNVNVVTRPVTSGQEANRNAEEQSSF